MKKLLKKMAFSAIIMMLAAAIIAPTAFASEAVENKNSGLIEKTLTSAIDGSPFIAQFDIETGKVTQLDMDGELLGYRYVENEEAFLALVAINAEVTSPSRARNAQRVSRNASAIDIKAKTFTEYDENGNKTETVLSDEELEVLLSERGYEKRDSTARFNTGWLHMFLPYSSHPSIGGAFFGGGFYTTSGSHRFLELYTNALASGMDHFDIHFTNLMGDDNSTILYAVGNSISWHSIRFPGDSYGARVSSFSNSGWVLMMLTSV